MKQQIVEINRYSNWIELRCWHDGKMFEVGVRADRISYPSIGDCNPELAVFIAEVLLTAVRLSHEFAAPTPPSAHEETMP